MARLLRLTFVPVSVEREIDGQPAAVTWSVDAVQMDENGRIAEKTVFRELFGRDGRAAANVPALASLSNRDQ